MITSRGSSVIHSPLFTASTHRPTLSAVAVLLACVFFVVPALRRGLDDTPIARDTPGFQFSKNLEFPHKKLSTMVVSAVCAEPMVLDPNMCECALPLDIVDIAHDVAGRPSPSRGPPLPDTL